MVSDRDWPGIAKPADIDYDAPAVRALWCRR
jgi:hypothetical protein